MRCFEVGSFLGKGPPIRLLLLLALTDFHRVRDTVYDLSASKGISEYLDVNNFGKRPIESLKLTAES